MGDERADMRPRILDFTRRIDDVRAVRDLAWPCHAFRVTLPVRPRGALNVFEETVLRLLGHTRLDDDQLHEVTGLDLYLVTLVCCRLRDLGLLTGRNELTGPGRTYIEERGREEPAYEVCFLFRERVSGALLPVVLEGALRFEELLDWGRAHARIRMGQDQLDMHLVLRTQDGTPQPPTPAEALRASQRHAELSHQYAFLRRDAVRAPRIVGGRQMSINPAPEQVFLRCRVVIPATEDDYRIGNPFGFGFSDTLYRAYEALREQEGEEQEFIRRLREKSLTVRPRRPSEKPREREAEEAVLACLDVAVTDYDELFKRLRKAEEQAAISLTRPRNRDEEAHFRYHAQQAAQSLAEALETALGHVVASSRAAACETTLVGRSQTYQGNAELLAQLAARLGFSTDSVGSLLQVAPGRVRALRDGGVDLQALVAVSLAAAYESPEHPLRGLAATFPGWLSFLAALKGMRDAGAHGKTRGGISMLKALREETYRSIAA